MCPSVSSTELPGLAQISVSSHCISVPPEALLCSQVRLICHRVLSLQVWLCILYCVRVTSVKHLPFSLYLSSQFTHRGQEGYEERQFALKLCFKWFLIIYNLLGFWCLNLLIISHVAIVLILTESLSISRFKKGEASLAYPVVRNPHFHCRGPGFHSWTGLRSHKSCGTAKKRNRKKKIGSLEKERHKEELNETF